MTGPAPAPTGISEAVEVWRAHIGMWLADVNETPDGEQMVVTLRKSGSGIPRHLTMMSTPYGLRAASIKDGCRILLQIASAKARIALERGRVG